MKLGMPPHSGSLAYWVLQKVEYRQVEARPVLIFRFSWNFSSSGNSQRLWPLCSSHRSHRVQSNCHRVEPPSLIVLMKRSSSSGQYVTSISFGYRARPKLAHSLPGPGIVSEREDFQGLDVHAGRLLRCQGIVHMLAAVQHGGKQIAVGPQIVKGPLAHVGAKMPNGFIDMLKRQVEGKLPHLLDQRLGSCRGSCLAGQAVVDGQSHVAFSLVSGSLSASRKQNRIRQLERRYSSYLIPDVSQLISSGAVMGTRWPSSQAENPSGSLPVSLNALRAFTRSGPME